MDNRFVTKFGKRVRVLRLERGLSQDVFAAKARLHRTYIGHVERGEVNITLLNMKKIADTLRVDLSELVRL